MRNDSTNNQNEIDILGYQLGLIDENERRTIEAVANDGADLAAKCDAVDAWLSPLNADDCEPPAGMRARIEARIAASRMPYLQPVGDAPGKSPFLSGRDLMALAAAITLFVGVFLPSYRQAHFRAEQAACANNLRSLGWAAGSYVADNGGYFPFVGSSTPSMWYRTGDRTSTTPKPVYRLVGGHYADPRAFVDPDMGGDYPMDHPDPASLSDFPDPRNNSYSFLRQFQLKPWMQYQFAPQMPIGGGTTPLVDQYRRLVIDRDVPANAPNHGGRGQNILRADFSVRFFTTPYAGPGGDNVYRVNGVDGNYDGHESPRSATDAFLTP